MGTRGQTLVLFSLTMLLISLMVLTTVSIGMRVKERAELQTVADAAAYSEAVVTARSFNAISVMNRVLIAEMSSVAAAQSLMSWAGFYHGTLNQARDLLLDLTATAAPQCDAALLDARQRIIREDRRLIDIWEPLKGGYEGKLGYDPRTANYLRSVLYATALQIAEDQKAIFKEMMFQVAPSPLASQTQAVGVVEVLEIGVDFGGCH